MIEDLYGGSQIGPRTVLEEHAPQTPVALAALWDLRLPFSPGYGVAERAAMRSR